MPSSEMWPCVGISCVNRRFGGTYRLHLQDKKNPRARKHREQVAADSSVINLHGVPWAGCSVQLS
jgi:hypothetical protein